MSAATHSPMARHQLTPGFTQLLVLGRIGLLAMATALVACGAPLAGPTSNGATLTEAEATIRRGEHARAIELIAPHAPGDDEATLLLAHARAGLARAQRAAAPTSPEALRAALDQLSLALPLASGHQALQEELRVAQRELAARLAQADAGQTAREVAHASSEPPPTPQPAQAPPAPGLRPESPAPRAAQPPALGAAQQAAYTVVERKSYEGGGNSGAFASCVDVQILGPHGPVAGAVIGINNGEHSYQNQTNGDGYTGRCGLGASTWSVVLFWTPQDGAVRGAASTVYVSGAPEQRAAVVFKRR